MRKTIWTTVLIGLGLFGAAAHATIPTTELYPFQGYDLEAVRAKTGAEWSPESKELNEAWSLYREIQGSWMPGAPKPREHAVGQLDALKRKLEAFPKPQWFSAALENPQSGQTKLADKVGDEIFRQQKATAEYDVLKALAIVCLTEHELDRQQAAQNAGKYLTALSMTHPWDWEIHGLYSRLLIDAKLPGLAWEAAKQSIYLNPKPSLEDLKFFAFIGSIAAKEKWPEIQDAIKQAATDKMMAAQAIAESATGYTDDAKVNIVEPKKR